MYSAERRGGYSRDIVPDGRKAVPAGQRMLRTMAAATVLCCGLVAAAIQFTGLTNPTAVANDTPPGWTRP